MSVTTPPSDSPSAMHNPSELVCLWKQCHLKFEDPELLYHHLSNDHVGRKATGNLCLECHWEKCEVKTGKRDHITSHLRVHVPLKPHVCETCNKAFKRRQDLKKHEKIHTEQHQQLISDHKHQRLQKTSHPQTPPQYPPARSPSVCSSIESQSSFPLSPNRVVPGFGFNTTPPHDNNYDNYDVYPNYDNYDISNPTVIPEFSNYNNVKRPDVSTGNTYVPASNKRTIDAVEEFYLDVKRKRVDPVYNQAMADRLDALESYINVSDLDSAALDSFTRSDLQNMETFFVQLSGGVLPYIDDAGITGGLSNAATPDSTGFDVGLSTLGSDMLPSDSVIYPTLGYASDAVHTPESLHERDDEETPIVPSTHLNDVTINPNDLDVNKTYLAGGLMSPPEETHEYAPQGLDEPNFNSLYPTMTNINLFDSTATTVSGSETIRIMKMPNPTVVTDAHVQHYITNMILEQKPNPGSQTKAKEGVTPTSKSRGVTNVKVVNVTKVDGKSDTKNNDIDALSSKIAKLDLEDEKKGSHERQLDADIRKKHAALIYALYQKIHKLYIEMEEKEKLAMNKETRVREVLVE